MMKQASVPVTALPGECGVNASDHVIDAAVVGATLQAVDLMWFSYEESPVYQPVQDYTTDSPQNDRLSN